MSNNDDYNPHSVNAVLSRMETKLDSALKRQEEHESAIQKLWAALGRLDVRVALIAGGISVAWAVGKAVLFK